MREIAKQQSFQEKISDKIKESIGDLITDEDLKPLIESSIKSLLLEKRKVPRNSGYGTDTTPALLDEILRPHLDTQLRILAEEYFTANPKVLREAIDKVLGDGILTAIHRVIESRMYGPIERLSQEIENTFVRKDSLSL